MKISRLFISLLSIFPAMAFGQCDSTMIFANDSTHEYCSEVVGTVRHFFANGIPPHPSGPFTGTNVIGDKDYAFYVCAFPQKALSPTTIFNGAPLGAGCNGISHIGISITGTYFSGYAARWFVDTAGMNNTNWLVEATSLNLDPNGSHIANVDRYHYHTPAHRYYLDSLGIDGSFHSPILGYAADGFPMYYRYVYDDPLDSTSAIIDLASCYQLKAGNRPGDGFTAPDGPYDGTYYQDWEYLPGPNCGLDECNGRFGITPEYPNGTYYYVMTNGFPDLPRCFYGMHPDNSFRAGQNCPPSSADTDCSINTHIHQHDHGALQFSLYPNPATDELTIEALDGEAFAEAITSIRVFNSLGNIVRAFAQPQKMIELSGLNNGEYYLEISSSSGTTLKKFMVQR